MKSLISIFIYLNSSLQLLACFLCVFLSMYYNFDEVNNTHCHVSNFLPSFSAAVGNYELQLTIWQYVTVPVCLFRLFILYLVYICWLEKYPKANSIITIMTIINFIEIVSLISLSIFSSSRYYDIHKISFITFLLMSIVFQVFNVYFSRKYQKIENSFLRRSICTSYMISILLAGLSFVIHNILCISYVYSVFGLSEYILITTNVVFHTLVAKEIDSLSIRDIFARVGRHI